jgi:hypothetical protein
MVKQPIDTGIYRHTRVALATKLTVPLDEERVVRLEEYRARRGLRSASEAIRELIDRSAGVAFVSRAAGGGSEPEATAEKAPAPRPVVRAPSAGKAAATRAAAPVSKAAVPVVRPKERLLPPVEVGESGRKLRCWSWDGKPIYEDEG